MEYSVKTEILGRMRKLVDKKPYGATITEPDGIYINRAILINDISKLYDVPEESVQEDLDYLIGEQIILADKPDFLYFNDNWTPNNNDLSSMFDNKFNVYD